MKTRKDLLEKKCTHLEYYQQFFNQGFIARVVDRIGVDRIMKSNDPNFNDIPLAYWDQISPPLGTFEKMREAGDYLTLSGKVCISKQAAKLFKMNELEKIVNL
jgi:hypothetical protein